jgi:hypothetical protein
MISPTTQERFDPKKSINSGHLKKNRKPPNAGIGRKPGTRNQITLSMRDMMQDFCILNLAHAQELYDRLAKREPGKALQILTNLCDFVLPRLARTEVVSDGNALISSVPITDPQQAASVYSAILGNSKIDLNLVVFQAPPHQGQGQVNAPLLIEAPGPLPSGTGPEESQNEDLFE